MVYRGRQIALGNDMKISIGIITIALAIITLVFYICAEAEGRKGKYRMSDLWAYHDNCEGDYCPMDCNRCPKAEEVFEDDDQDFS